MEFGIGIDDFKSVVEESIYVDKTFLLKNLLHSPRGSTFLFTRPRRFGKSLALSMMEYFLSDARASAKPLFAPYAIAKDPALCERHQNTYRVLHLNFKDVLGNDYDSMIQGIASKVALVYDQHRGYLDKLEEEKRESFERILRCRSSQQELIDSLRNLCSYIVRFEKKDVVLLIDEYDSPILRSRDGGFYDNAIAFFSAFYGTALKSNQDLCYGVLTGVAQIEKESIFSGLNNLVVNNVFSHGVEYFGFTKDEVSSLLEKAGLDNLKDEAETNYGGYRFGDNDVYNPWSVLSMVSAKGRFGLYWTSTSENSLIAEVLRSGDEDPELFDALYRLGSMNTFRTYLDQIVSFQDIHLGLAETLSLLVSSGYLTATESFMDGTMEIRIPNREISSIFYKEITLRYLTPSQRVAAFNLSDAFRSKDIHALSDALETYLLNAFSAYEMNDEKSYQVMVLTLCAVAFQSHLVKAEQNVGKGRCDIIVYPTKGDPLGIVIETKFYKSKVSSSALRALAEKALEQIHDREYASDLKKMGASPIHLFGFAFAKKHSAIVSQTAK